MSLYVGALVGILSVAWYPLRVKNFQELKWAVSNNSYKICIGRNTAFHAAVLVRFNVNDLRS